MANKADRFYFKNFVEAAECCCKAADYLVECLSNYDPDKISFMLESMHAHEHMADMKKHEMSSALAKAFVTPLDREDLDQLSQNIDEVADKVEEVLQRFYVNQIQTVTPEAIEFARKIAGCCRLMREMLRQFENFRRQDDELQKLIIELNNAEEECDGFYLQAAVKIRTQCTNVLEVLDWREIYDYMEECADACEHVADCISTIVMKNT